MHTQRKGTLGTHETSARSECTHTNRILTPPSTQIRINNTLPTSREGNGSIWMRDFTIDRNHTISCRHWASSTSKFPTCRETSESTNKDSTLNLSSTHRKYRCRLYYRKGRWTGKSSFQHLSNNTHFYTPTPKLNKQPSEMDFIGNHRKTTFVHLQISTQTHSQRSQTQHSASTQKPLAIRQPNLYIASQQTGGFSATKQKKKRKFSLQHN